MSRPPPVTPTVAVVGATASGKSDLALDLAEALGGEIVNTDAMAVYRGMDIGTAKQPPAERRGIEHHLLDLLEVTETLTVAEFQGRARAVIADLRDRHRVPVLVGGSALYTRAVLDRFEFPGTDEAVRRRLEVELEEVGAPRAAPAAGRARPRRREHHPGRQRTAHRAGAGGRGDHRSPVHRVAAGARVRRPAQRPDRGRHRPRDAGGADRGAGGGGCSRRGSWTRCRGCSTRGSARAGRP